MREGTKNRRNGDVEIQNLPVRYHRSAQEVSFELFEVILIIFFLLLKKKSAASIRSADKIENDALSRLLLRCVNDKNEFVRQ